MNIDEMIEVMQAYRDGAKIETKGKNEPNVWTEVDDPLWEWCSQYYRIKKEPRTLTLWRLANSNMEWRVAKEGDIHPAHETMVVKEVLDD